MQVCTSLQADNHNNTPPLSFFTGRMPFLPPNQQRQSTEGISKHWRDLPTCHRERKRNLVQAEFVLIRRSLCKFVWNWVPKLLRWVGKLSYYRVCGTLFVVWVVMWLCLRDDMAWLLLSILTRPIRYCFMDRRTNHSLYFILTLNQTTFVLLILDLILPTLLTLQSSVLTLAVHIIILYYANRQQHSNIQ